MQIKTLVLAVAAAAPALALPGWGNTVPGYPWGFGFCLSDQQANWVVQQYKSILMNNNRAAAVQTASQLVDNNYQETSDSINVLAGQPQGSVSFSGKGPYLDGLKTARAIPQMTDLDVWHDCNTIGWQWIASGLGINISPVKGFNKFVVDPNSGLVKSTDLEFNNIAWGRDIFWTCTPPSGPPSGAPSGNSTSH